jgi:hypothetical protein
VRQNVEKETSEELLAGERHLSFLLAVGVVLPGESDLVILKGEQAMIGDGDAMGVASQVAEHTVRSSERGFGINDPILTEESSEEGSERLQVAQRLQASGEDELPLAETPLQAGHEFASQDTTEHFDREQEGIVMMNPALVIR